MTGRGFGVGVPEDTRLQRSSFKRFTERPRILNGPDRHGRPVPRDLGLLRVTSGTGRKEWKSHERLRSVRVKRINTPTGQQSVLEVLSVDTPIKGGKESRSSRRTVRLSKVTYRTIERISCGTLVRWSYYDCTTKTPDY